MWRYMTVLTDCVFLAPAACLRLETSYRQGLVTSSHGQAQKEGENGKQQQV